MKEAYEKPRINTEYFFVESVITTSDIGSDIGKDDNIVDGSDGW